MSVKVVTDSGSGMSKADAEKLGIGYLPLQVTVDGKQYLDGVDLDIETLYDALADGKMPMTSMPPLGLVEDMLEQYKEEGIDEIILVSLSNGLSGTNGTFMARAEDHGIKVRPLDVWTTMALQNYAAKAAAQLLEQGKKPEEIVNAIQEMADVAKGYLIPEDLDHLAAGGRLTPMAAKLGGLLKIKPILEVSKDSGGKVDVNEKVRTMSKAMKKAASLVQENIVEGRPMLFEVMDSRNPEAKEQFKDILKELFGEDIVILEDPIPSVIAAHTGLGAVGVQYIPAIEGVTA